ncbi:MAG: hypothetical protein WAU28_00815 [Candidatus Moraniibacteriota bacterium]
MTHKKGCDHKPECDCIFGEDACLRRLAGNGPTSMKDCHPKRAILEKALKKAETRQRVLDTRIEEIRIRWSTHRM